jgi:hypothetical protein
MVNDRIECALDAAFAALPDLVCNASNREWLRPAIEAALDAWDHGGATLVSDFPIDASSIDIVTNEDGSLTVRRKPGAWRALHEGYGPDHS